METFLMFLGFPMNWGLGAGFGGMNQGFGNSGGRGESIVNSLKDGHLWDRHKAVSYTHLTLPTSDLV